MITKYYKSGKNVAVVTFDKEGEDAQLLDQSVKGSESPFVFDYSAKQIKNAREVIAQGKKQKIGNVSGISLKLRDNWEEVTDSTTVKILIGKF